MNSTMSQNSAEFRNSLNSRKETGRKLFACFIVIIQRVGPTPVSRVKFVKSPTIKEGYYFKWFRLFICPIKNPTLHLIFFTSIWNIFHKSPLYHEFLASHSGIDKLYRSWAFLSIFVMFFFVIHFVSWLGHIAWSCLIINQNDLIKQFIQPRVLFLECWNKLTCFTILATHMLDAWIID